MSRNPDWLTYGLTVGAFALIAAAKPQGPAPDAQTLIYVSNKPVGAPYGSIEYFRASANGDAPPVGQIAGSNAQMLGTGYLVVDSKGTIWAAQESGPYVAGYSAGARGDVAPNFLIAGSNTELSSPVGLGIDGSDNLYVGNCGPICSGTVDNIVVFGSGSDGNAPPGRIIAGSKTRLLGISGVTIDAHGNVWVANRGTYSVMRYEAGRSGNVAPSCSISGLGTDPNGIAFDRRGELYVRDGSGAIAVFRPGTCGRGRPARIISGRNTGLDFPDGLFVGSDGTLYVANRLANSITEYAPGSAGNVQPIRTIRGVHTGLNGPVGIYVR
jgi:hypothetical protein